MSLFRIVWVAVAVMVAGCGESVTSEEPARPSARAESPAPARSPAPASQPPPTKPAHPTPAGVDPKVVAEASDLAKRGLEAYSLGHYDEAENLLKRSITVYPFLAQANLGLGKVFLLRGAASHDRALIDSARLMFQMAHSNDPELREPEILMKLFEPQAR